MSNDKTEAAGWISTDPSAFAATAGSASVAPTPADRPVEAAAPMRGEILNRRYGDHSAAALVEAMLRAEFHDRIALVSSFGTESAVLLDLVAKVDPVTPVLLLDTGRLFAETLRYRDTLSARLGLTDIRILSPDAGAILAEDGDGELWRTDADRCCHLRKVMPLMRGLKDFDAWITGRKRFQGGERGRLSTIEVDDGGKVKINPLANWTPADIATYFVCHDLPRHDMETDGYRSIGCVPCTTRVDAWEGARVGRWRHTYKTECGIHRLSSAPPVIEVDCAAERNVRIQGIFPSSPVSGIEPP